MPEIFELDSYSGIAASLLSIGNHKSTLDNNPGMKDQVIHLIGLLRSAMFPHVFGGVTGEDMGSAAFAVEYALRAAAKLLEQLLKTVQPDQEHEEQVRRFLQCLPEEFYI